MWGSDSDTPLHLQSQYVYFIDLKFTKTKTVENNKSMLQENQG